MRTKDARRSDDVRLRPRLQEGDKFTRSEIEPWDGFTYNLAVGRRKLMAVEMSLSDRRSPRNAMSE